MKVAALILCGGKSKRMGTDKGLIKSEGNHWLSLVKKEIPEVCSVFISVGDHNIKEYKKAKFDQLIVDEDIPNVVGAVRALLSFIKQIEDKEIDYIIVTAVDMLRLRSNHFEQMIDKGESCAFSIVRKVQSIPFMIKKSDVDLEMDYTNISLKHLLSNVWKVSEIKMNTTDFLTNYNYPADINC